MKTKVRLGATLVAAIFLVCLVSFVHSDVTAINGNIPKDRQEAIRLGFAPPLNWMMDKWDGNDKPYTEIRRSIDAIYDHGQFRRSVLEAYRREAREHPDDPVAQYRWGYAFYQAKSAGFSLGSSLQDSDAYLEIAWAMVHPPSPHSYEHTRLLFINYSQRSMYRLAPLGYRLLQHTPEDYDIEFYLYKGLASARTPAERAEALANAQKLIRQYPNRGGPYGVLAEVYSSRWEKGEAEAGPPAIANYQKYLSLQTKGLTPEVRADLGYWMNFIRTHPKGPKGPKIK